MIYFAPEAQEEYAGIGLSHHRTGYFASRAAPMGPVPAEVVIATFFNFYPPLVRRAIDGVWETASPAEVTAARLRGADRALRRAFGDALASAQLVEVSAIARTAALAACQHLEGRPLFAGHASLPWPDEPHLVLWHAQTLLREYRGDGHVATLREEGLSGVEALVMHGASGEVPPLLLQSSRAWPDTGWAAAVDHMRERGFLDADGNLTDAGRAHRKHVEERTDALATGAYEALGDEDAEHLVQAGRRFSRMVIDAGLLPAQSMSARPHDQDATPHIDLT
jgi:hypothetical protein